jgi:hypothetical protein
MNTRAGLIRILGLPESSTDDDILRALTDAVHPSIRPLLPEALRQSSPTYQLAQTFAEALNLRQQATAPTTGPVVDDPQAEFERLAEQYAADFSVSLAEGYSAVSREAPILFDRARARAMLNGQSQ